MKKVTALIFCLLVSFSSHVLANDFDLVTVSKLAEQGDAKAQFNLGSAYIEGEYVTQDFQVAREWLEKSAAQNYPDAQLGLGLMYAFASGVPMDFETARMWFQKACDNGEQEGCDMRDSLR